MIFKVRYQDCDDYVKVTFDYVSKSICANIRYIPKLSINVYGTIHHVKLYSSSYFYYLEQLEDDGSIQTQFALTHKINSNPRHKNNSIFIPKYGDETITDVIERFNSVLKHTSDYLVEG